MYRAPNAVEHCLRRVYSVRLSVAIFFRKEGSQRFDVVTVLWAEVILCSYLIRVCFRRARRSVTAICCHTLVGTSGSLCTSSIRVCACSCVRRSVTALCCHRPVVRSGPLCSRSIYVFVLSGVYEEVSLPYAATGRCVHALFMILCCAVGRSDLVFTLYLCVCVLSGVHEEVSQPYAVTGLRAEVILCSCPIPLCFRRARRSVTAICCHRPPRKIWGRYVRTWGAGV